MRSALNAIGVYACLTACLVAADPPQPKAPTADELLHVTEAARDFYRAAQAADAAAKQRQDALDRALRLKADLEKKYACDLNLDTNVCSPSPTAKPADATASKETK